MAKKGKKVSPAEIQRRQQQRAAQQQISGNNSWDDCQRLHGQCTSLLEQAGAVELVLKQPGVYHAVKDKSLLNDNIRLLAKDTHEMTGRLELIYAEHKDKFGSCRTPNDFALSLKLYELYIQFMESYRTTITPVLNHIFEQTAEAEKRIAMTAAEIEAEELAKQAQDPNNHEPIDVEVRDVPARGEVPGIIPADEFGRPLVRDAQTERAALHVKLDENDPNPQGTVEAVIAEHKVA